jgi:hypothetical protein
MAKTFTFETTVHKGGGRFVFLREGRKALGIPPRGRGRRVNMRVFDALSGDELLPRLRNIELRSGNEIYGDDVRLLGAYRRIRITASIAQSKQA